MQQLASNRPLILIAILIALAGTYWYFFTGSGEEPSLTEALPASRTQLRFEALISQLQPISFPTAIFSDPRFTVLVDLATPIAPEPAGRPDPFAAFQ